MSGASGFELSAPLCHCAALANDGGPFVLTDGECTVTPNQDSIFHPVLLLPPLSWLSVLNQKSRGWFSELDSIGGGAFQKFMAGLAA